MRDDWGEKVTGVPRDVIVTGSERDSAEGALSHPVRGPRTHSGSPG